MAITTINSLAIPAGTVVSADLTYPLTGFSSTGIDDNATSTAITIDASENVGIGTASPDGKLNVVKGTASGTTASTSANNIVIDGTSGTETGITLFSTVASGIRFGDASGAGQGVIEYAHGTDHMRFVTNATERMRIDSSGNVGIGTATTTATRLTATTATANHVGLLVENSNAADSFGMVVKAGNDANDYTADFRKRDNTTIMRIRGDGNVGIGTASPFGELSIKSASPQVYLETVANGNVQINFNETADQLDVMVNNSNGKIAFGTNSTERMRIDSSGNVTIDGSDASTSLASTAILNLKAGDANNEYSILRFATSADGSIAYIGAKATTTGAYPSSVGNLEFGVQNGASTVTAMTINNSGNVGIGTTSPSGSLHVSGTNTTIRITDTASTADYSFQATANDIRLYDNTAAAERMRIDSSGNLMVGTTVADASGITLNTAGYIKTYRGTTTAASQILFSNPNGVVGQVQTSGTATSYLTSSDVRLKENIVDAPAGNIDAIRVRSFDWKADGSHQTYGMVAQELVDVAPEAVSQGDTDDDMWAVDYSKLVPMMIKEIQDLKAEVAALKGA